MLAGKSIVRASLVLLLVVSVLAAFWLGGQTVGQGKKAKAKPKFESVSVTSKTKGHAVNIDVDITGAKKLFLVVTDGGDGISCDWANWAEPRLVGPKGEKKLTELKWKSAQSGWGKVLVNRNTGGKDMMIAGKPVSYGIGTHSHSVIAFDLPKGYTRFKARGGLDHGGTSQQGGNVTSVRFLVFVDQLPAIAAKPKPVGGGRSPLEAVASFDVPEGLEAKLFASEPLMLNPTNIDIDHRGRIWVCEVVNYRRRNGTRKEGDRILILEDTNGDGVADKKKVYYQGRDVDSAMGICVLGNKVIVSCSPNVFVFTDEDGDDKPDKKEKLFTKTGSAQHDHSAHAFVFGPDGRLYWNFGNTGRSVHDKDGKPVIDMAGNQVTANNNPYRQGMVFRCNMDGSGFEVLGWNFRNNYEVTVDSFGTLWQSDNDDDGNRGVRINYVMEFGNFGYTDEMTGAGWKTARTGMAADIPSRHWHLNDPGVVPNLVQTGAGSPTGICFYEGKLLPNLFRNQVIHTDAGPNIVRAYPAVKDGAGYQATIANIIDGKRDKWFRPADVCTAPDGSLFVADWYDPGVGGHGMGDIDRGRVFRVAPPNTPYRIPKFDFATADGAVEALQNPALSVRYLAWKSLNDMQGKAEPALLKLFESKSDAHLRARALWLLGHIKGKAQHYADRAAADKDSDIRIVGIRMARQLKLDVLVYVKKLANDASPQVRRECAIALRGNKSPEAVAIWTELAKQHDGKDRWYLEALGIAARGNWNALFDAWLQKVGARWNTPAGRDIVWRSRAAKTPEYLVKIISDPTVTKEQLPRYFRALDFQSGSAKDQAIVELAFAAQGKDAARNTYIASEALKRLKGFDVTKNPKYKAALERILKQSEGTSQFVSLVGKFNITARYPDLLVLAQKNPTSQLGVDAIVALLSKGQYQLIGTGLQAKDVKMSLATAQALGTSKDGRAMKLLYPIVNDAKRDLELRREAVRSLTQSRQGAQAVVKLARSKKLYPGLKDATAAALHGVTWRDIKNQANQLFPLPKTKDVPLPPIADLIRVRGDIKRGKLVFQKTGTCANCHIVHKEGKEVGPDLSEIGTKLSKQAMFESILFPSAAISHNYESYLVLQNNGNVLTGLLLSQTPGDVTLKGPDAIVRKIKKSDIDEMTKQPVSLMPADLLKNISKQDLVDVVAYMGTLKKK